MNFVFALFSIALASISGIFAGFFAGMFLTNQLDMPDWSGMICGTGACIVVFTWIFNALREFFKF